MVYQPIMCEQNRNGHGNIPASYNSGHLKISISSSPSLSIDHYVIMGPEVRYARRTGPKGRNR